MEVLVTGSTGFVGRHLVPALRNAGHAVRCLHRPTSDLRVLPRDVARVSGDVRDAASLRSAVEGMDAVVHLVAILREREASFEAVNVQGVRNLLQACREPRPHLVHVGALGTREDAPSRYARSKAHGERLVREAGLPHTVLRPGHILGPGGDFTARFQSVVDRSRKVPMVGSGEAALQPLAVEDMVAAVAAALEAGGHGRVWDLVGPERLTWRAFVERVAAVRGLRRSVRRVPPPVARLGAALMRWTSRDPLVTRDEVLMMQEDVVGDPRAFHELTGRTPTPLDRTLQRAFGR